jgi:2-keto-4-pentenoate hydratase/2-oxohepta-3-ene-1,7-dioic acid hydratase in catechol pathway
MPRADSFRLASYSGSDATARAAIVVDESVLDVGEALATAHAGVSAAVPTTTLDVLRRWAELLPRLHELARQVREHRVPTPLRPLADVQLLAPVPNPGGIFCAGANYRDHVEEMSKALKLPPEPDPRERGLKPWHFVKASGCVCGPGAAIELPSYSKKVDWEAEVALVIGRECRNVGADRALDHAAGLTIANDLSARDYLRREGVSPESPFRFDWLSQKCFDGALPLGPWITPLDEIDDVGRIGIRLWVNDELMQDSSTSNMIFTMAEQVAHLSTRLTLRPGDVVVTGTPAGVGSARGRFLRAGDRVRIQVQGVGELTNTFCP